MLYVCVELGVVACVCRYDLDRGKMKMSMRRCCMTRSQWHPENETMRADDEYSTLILFSILNRI